MTELRASFQNHKNFKIGGPKAAKELVKPIASDNEQLILDGIIEMANRLKTTKTDATFSLRKAKLILLVNNL